jgi:hypothetical protein
MLKQRRQAAEQVAERLFAAEQAIDAAITCAAELTAIMPSARAGANLSAIVGQDAMESAAETFAALIRARHQIVTTHQQLDETKTQIGLREMAVGGGMEKPAAQAGHLTIVNQVAA